MLSWLMVVAAFAGRAKPATCSGDQPRSRQPRDAGAQSVVRVPGASPFRAGRGLLLA